MVQCRAGCNPPTLADHEGRATLVVDGSRARGVLPVITIYRGARAPVPVASADLPWPDLVRELEALANEPTAAPETASPEEQKKRMIAWSPHALRVPYRLAENVVEVTLLVLDVDNDDRPESPVTPEEIVGRLHAHRLAGLVYESPSSTPVLPKFRVVAPITEPIPPDACRETRTRFAEMLGLGPRCGVHQAIDAAKLFFAGRLRDTPPRRVWVTEGSPVDPRDLPPNSERWATAFRAAPTTSPHLAELPPADRGIVAAIGPWQQHSGRKWDICGKLGGLMRRDGYTAHQCEATIREWLAGAPADVDVDAGVEWALGAWRHPVGDVSGEDELARVVGPDHARVIAHAVEAGSWPDRIMHLVPKAALQLTSPAHAAGGDPLGTRRLLSGDDEPIPYVCPGLCLAPNLGGKISMLGGLPGAGKGPFEAYICVCVALGIPLFDAFPVVRQKVLYVDLEGWRLTRRRLRRIALGLGRDPRELDDHLELWDSLALMDDRTRYRLAEHEARFIALDSYTTAMLRYDLDQNKNEYARGAEALAMLADRTVLPITHARKPSATTKHEAPDLSDISGSGALGALAQTGISVWKPDPATPSRIAVACLRAPETPFAPFEVEFRDTPNGGLTLTRITTTEVAAEARRVEVVGLEAATNAILRFMRDNPRPWSRRDLAANVYVGLQAIPDKQVSQATSMLLAAGFIVRHESIGSKSHTYEIASVQTAPRAVRVMLDGTVVPADVEFRRPE